MYEDEEAAAVVASIMSDSEDEGEGKPKKVTQVKKKPESERYFRTTLAVSHMSGHVALPAGFIRAQHVRAAGKESEG